MKGILKKLPKEIAENLERELRAKAELFLAQIKLEMLTKAKGKVGDEGEERFLTANSGITAIKPDQNQAI